MTESAKKEQSVSINSAPKQVSCAAIGDSGVGKTTILVNYVLGPGHGLLIPSLFENHTVDLVVDSQPVRLSICDTPGGDIHRLRPLLYASCNVFLICFSLIDRGSFDRIESHVCTELRRYMSKKIPRILVGTKLDLRDDKEAQYSLGEDQIEMVSYAEGLAKSKTIGAAAYLECSGIMGKGVSEIFQAAATIVLNQPQVKRKPACYVL